MNQKTKYVLLSLWLAATFPFTLLGYGSDPDAWRVARTAKTIWMTGEYSRSRTTGFPLFELLVAPLVNLGQWYLSNILPLLFGIGLIVALFHLVRKGALSHPTLCILSLAFLPIIIKNASSTMDYVPALTLLLWAYVAMLDGKWTLAAVLIGIACGFRPTSGLFVIPVGVYAYLETKHATLVLKVLVVAFVCGVIAYSPALLKYGIFIPHGGLQLDTQTRILKTGYHALQLFGIVQSVALGFMFLLAIRKRTITKTIDPFLIFHLSNIGIWVSLYLLMAAEPEYMIPLVPSVILILDKASSTRSFAIITIILLSYHLVQVDARGGESGLRRIDVAIKPGFTVRDVQDRLFKLSTRQAATNYVAARNTVLILGSSWIPAANDKWVYDDQHGMYRQGDGNLFVSEPILDETKLKELKSAGFRLVVWRHAKSPYIRTDLASWQNYVEVTEDLSSFFGVSISGTAISQR